MTASEMSFFNIYSEARYLCRETSTSRELFPARIHGAARSLRPLLAELEKSTILTRRRHPSYLRFLDFRKAVLSLTDLRLEAMALIYSQEMRLFAKTDMWRELMFLGDRLICEKLSIAEFFEEANKAVEDIRRLLHEESARLTVHPPISPAHGESLDFELLERYRSSLNSLDHELQNLWAKALLGGELDQDATEA